MMKVTCGVRAEVNPRVVFSVGKWSRGLWVGKWEETNTSHKKKWERIEKFI